MLQTCWETLSGSRAPSEPLGSLPFLLGLRLKGARDRVPSWAWPGHQSFWEWSQLSESSFLIRASGIGKTRLAAERGPLIMAGKGHHMEPDTPCLLEPLKGKLQQLDSLVSFCEHLGAS